MVQNEETQYIARILNGDTEAFSVFLDRYSRPLYVLIVQIVGCPEDAEELVQDVFLKVFRCLDSYKGECRFSTWLYKITCNTCYDRLRSLHHSPLDNEADYSVSANISSDDNVELAVVNKQLCELILRYTDELSPRQRLIFTLRDIEELDVPEVQIITGLSAGIIKTTLYLARKNIRNKMNQIDAGL